MFVVLSLSLPWILEFTKHPHRDFFGRSSPNDLTSYLIWMHLLVCRVIIDLVVLSLDYCRVNGCDADGDYSIISNRTRQHLQMEPYISAKEAAGLSASLQSCDYLKRLIFFPLVILNRNLKWYEAQTIVGLCFQEYHFCTVWPREMCWNIIRRMEIDKIQANPISLVTRVEHLDMLVVAMVCVRWHYHSCGILTLSCSTHKQRRAVLWQHTA